MRSSANASLAIERHPLVTRVLHWATVVMLLVSVSAILYRETTEHRMLRQVLMELHRQLGLLLRAQESHHAEHVHQGATADDGHRQFG